MWWPWRRNVREHKFEELVLRRLDDIEKLLKAPTLTAFQAGDPMAIGNITAGTTGQFACALNWPSGVTPPANYAPIFIPSSPDSLITFAAATVDETGGAIPLAQQVVLTVPQNDTATSGAMGFAALGVDGSTTLQSNLVTFVITPAVTSPTEPTLVASQVA
jgi:hypothetical protein